ncbi:MAG: BCD family MFS transporter [Chloroflexi bacterium]|nr:BCD family MFS transporter [Chloroflexota bacterium]
MRIVSVVLNGVKVVIKTLRLSLPKLGVGWMFALLTINLNRIAIVELGITAVVITAMLALHYFLSPFQVISGRIADRHPIAGFKRSPYLLASSVVASSVFIFLPTIVINMGAGEVWAYLAGLLAFVIYGIAIAVMGDSHHSLIAEVTDSRTRGAVISVVWTFTIISTIFAAIIMNIVMPEFSPEAMQRLYNLSPVIVIGFTFLGVVGMEKRMNAEEQQASIARAKAVAPEGNPVSVAVEVLRRNKQARGFFLFVFISILAIFLQDNILEVFGAEVFNMPLTETTRFQPTWGGGVLLGMVIMGALSAIFSVSKRTIVIVGCVGTALGMLTLATAALTHQVAMVLPALVVMGLFTGFFNVGALSMMMDMTIDGATGLYMGLWGTAQAFGNGTASFGGALHTGLIETGLLAPNVAYFTIFGMEAVGMTVAAIIVWRLSVTRFRSQHAATLTRADALRAMESGAAA